AVVTDRQPALAPQALAPEPRTEEASRPQEPPTRPEPEPVPALAPAPEQKSPGVEPDDPMSEAGRKILRFHFRRMLRQESGARQGDDPEAVHDMRVATRRLRAALRVFGPYYDPGVIHPLDRGLRRAGRALGAVRDLDV